MHVEPSRHARIGRTAIVQVRYACESSKTTDLLLSYYRFPSAERRIVWPTEGGIMPVAIGF